jgi:hypothetical protein
MASLRTLLVVGLATFASALPSSIRLNERQINKYNLMKRQTAGLTDFDIAQFALTLEWLEGTFYQQVRLNIQPEQMTALGLSIQQVNDIFQIGATELEHVSFLQTTLAGAGIQPVAPCTYNFGAAVTDPATFLQTAAILENVGVSAYLGAAPLIADKGILSAAGSILTVEARHQSFIRTVTGKIAIPSAFDGALGPRAVFSLAAPFIASCPDGSNLAITAFPPVAPTDPAAAPVAGQNIQVTSPAQAGATFCGFTSGDARPGGTTFVPFDQAAGCQIPQISRGIVYMTLTNANPTDGVLTDDIVVAGPAVLTIT